jgi:hypothetical protein
MTPIPLRSAILSSAILLSVLGAAPSSQGSEDGNNKTLTAATVPAADRPVPVPVVVSGRESGGWGYIDRAGAWVVPPVLEWAARFREGEALVQVDLERVRITDTKTFEVAESEGVKRWRAGKRSTPPRNNQYCFIDTTGKVVAGPFQCDNQYVCELSESFAVVQHSAGISILYTQSFGYIDRTGKWLIQPQWPEAHAFSGGLARVIVKGTNRGRAGITNRGGYGYVDATGKLAISDQFEDARDFSEGFAAVKIKGQWGYIDKTGAVMIQPQFHAAEPFSNGLAAVWDKFPGGAMGYIDKTGELVVPCRYNTAWEFSEGLARVAMDAAGAPSKCGFIDKSGAEVIPLKYEFAGDFSCGLAFICLGGKYGYVNKAGKEVTPPEYARAWPLCEGLGRFRLDTAKGPRYGYVDTSGAVSIPATFLDAEDFHDGLARVEMAEGAACIDPAGRIVWREKDSK